LYFVSSIKQNRTSFAGTTNDPEQADVERLVLNGLEELALTAQPIGKDLFSRGVNSNRPGIVGLVHDERITLDCSVYTL